MNNITLTKQEYALYRAMLHDYNKLKHVTALNNEALESSKTLNEYKEQINKINEKYYG